VANLQYNRIIIEGNMDTQKTLDYFIKSRKRPTTEDGYHKKELMNTTSAIHTPTRKLSFDCSVQQTIKKQKVCQLVNYTLF